MKKAIYFLLFLLFASAYPVGRLYYHLTDGFRMGNITEPFAWHPSWEVASPQSSCQQEVERALSQEYRYLGKGCQSYVFVSGDGQYVLKFFKYQRYRPSRFLSWLPSYRLEKQIEKQEKRERFCQSWKCAFEELSYATGLLHVQLNLSDGKCPLVLYDKMGFRHCVDLHEHQYLLQRRAIPFTEAVAMWEEKKEREKTVAYLEELITLLLDEYDRGIYDHDPALVQNVGVWEGRPIHLDVGQFRQDPMRKGLAHYTQDFYDKMCTLHEWLAAHHPDLAQWVDKRRREILQNEYGSLQRTETKCY